MFSFRDVRTKVSVMDMIRKILLVFPFIWEQVLVFAACPVLLGSHTTETVGLGTSDFKFGVDPSADSELVLVGIPQFLGIRDWQRQNPKKPQISNVKPHGHTGPGHLPLRVQGGSQC